MSVERLLSSSSSSSGSGGGGGGGEESGGSGLDSGVDVVVVVGAVRLEEAGRRSSSS